MSQGLLLLASTEFMIATLVTAAPAVSTAKPNIVCVQDCRRQTKLLYVPAFYWLGLSGCARLRL